MGAVSLCITSNYYMMKKNLLLLFVFFIVNQHFILYSQDSNVYCIAFYNVENLFHPSDDSLKNDDAFTPSGFNHWTYKKYIRKINNISKVFIAMNEYSPPDLIGMAEVEEASVLKKMCYDSPLQKYRYRYVHYDSPDARGVDVALLYRGNRVRIVRSRPIPVVFPFEPMSKNRDVLYAVAQFRNGDSLHLFVNHWTSRYSGYAPTIPKRNYYASVVKQMCDSILSADAEAKIVIMGDFNDYPTDESMTEVLQVGDCENPQHQNRQLFNLMYRFLKMNNIGSHKHEDFWGCLDQIIVSRALMDSSSELFIINREAQIFNADFLLEPDEKYGGTKTFRTFSGPRYVGGYADHLPVYIKIETN